MINNKNVIDLSSKNPDVVKNCLEAILSLKYLLNKKGLYLKIKKTKSKKKIHSS